MRWANLEENAILEQCPYTSRKKRVEWLFGYFDQLEINKDYACFEPNDIKKIIEWLKITER